MTSTDYRRMLRGRRCYVGMDLSTTTDLTALAAVFPDGDGGYDVLCRCFVPKLNIAERVRRDGVPYEELVRRGHLTATPGNWVDYEAVRQLLKDWAAEFQLREIAFDPWNATDLVTRLTEMDGFVCVPMRQGFNSLSAPTKSLEKLVLSKQLRHDGDPVLRWCIGNVCIERDAAGNMKPSKKVSTERIDAAVALIMAIDRAEHNAAFKPPSYSLTVLGGRR